MGTKRIQGDLNITGTYKRNGTAISVGTKLYLHSLVMPNTTTLTIFNNDSTVISGNYYTISNIIANALLLKYAGAGVTKGIVISYANNGPNELNCFVCDNTGTIQSVTFDLSSYTDTVTEL